jgi:hypothetical protein
MNGQYDILLLGPAGPERERLVALLVELGHRVATDPAQAGVPYDLALVDLRADQPGRATAALGALDPALPLLALASEPGPALQALRGRASMVLTGAERPSGYQVALAVCAALRRGRAPTASLAQNRGSPSLRMRLTSR